MSKAEALAAAVIEMFELWQVPDGTTISILGGRDETLEGVLDRIVILLSINDALGRIYSDPRRVSHWINSPNAIFEGRSPLQVMAQGVIASLKRVSAYVAAEAQGW